MDANMNWHQFLSSEERLKLMSEQRSKARKERLLQVRHQDARLAAVRLKEFRAQVAAGQQKLAQQLEAQWKTEHQQKIATLEAELAASLADVGRSQREAQQAVAEKALRAEAAAAQAEENWRNAQARFAGALHEEQVRRHDLGADHRAAEARRHAVEESMRIERALARIAAQNAEIRQRAEQAAAAAREPRVLPDMDGPNAFRHTHLHQQLLERAPLTNIPGAENAPPKRVVKYALPEIHIKGLDDSRVAAEVERRRFEADRERRAREREEAHSRTVEREAAARFRVNVWRQREEALLVAAQARRAEALDSHRAFVSDDDLVTSLLPENERKPAATDSPRRIRTRVAVAPAEPAQALPNEGAADVRAGHPAHIDQSGSPSATAIPAQRPEPPAAHAGTALPAGRSGAITASEQASADRRPSEGPNPNTRVKTADVLPATVPPEASASMSESLGRSQPDSPDARTVDSTEAHEKIGRTDALPGSQADVSGDRPGGDVSAGSESPPKRASASVGADVATGGQESPGRTGGWLPRIGEDSPFVDRRGYATGREVMRRSLEALVDSGRSEGIDANATGPGGDAKEGVVVPGGEPSPEDPEEVSAMGLREVLEQLVALEAARTETGRESENVFDSQRLGNVEERSQAGFAAGDDLRQSLEEFIAMERELYDKEQRDARFRGRADVGGQLQGFGGLVGRREGEGASPLRGFKSLRSLDGDGNTREPEANAVVTSSLMNANVSRSAEPAGDSGLVSGFEGRGLGNQRRSAAQQPLAYTALDYASSDFTLMSSPTSGLSPFSLMTSPLSNFSESELDALLEEDLLAVHVSSFELGHVHELYRAAEGPSQATSLTAGQGSGLAGTEGLTTGDEPGRSGYGLGLTEEGTSSASQAREAVGGPETEADPLGVVPLTDPRTQTPNATGASRHFAESAEDTSQFDSLTTGLSGFGLSSLLPSSGSHGTGSAEQTSEGDSDARLLATGHTTNVTATSRETLATSTGRSESSGEHRVSSRDSQPTVPEERTLSFLSHGDSSPILQTVSPPPGFSPGAFQPTQDSSRSDSNTAGQAPLGDSQPPAQMQRVSYPPGPKTDHLLPGAQGQVGQQNQPVDDRFAQLKRELDEFDERLLAVRAKAYAPLGETTQIPSAVFSGLSSTTSTSVSDAQPAAYVIPPPLSSTAGIPSGLNAPPAPTGFADVNTTSAGTGGSGASLTVSSLGFTSFSSPVSQTLSVNPAPNPVFKPSGSTVVDVNVNGPPPNPESGFALEPAPQLSEGQSLKGDHLVANASGASLEGRPPSMSTALDFSDTNLKLSEAAKYSEVEQLRFESLGEGGPSSAVGSATPKSLTVDGLATEAGESETGSRFGVDVQTQKAALLGRMGIDMGTTEQLLFSDQSLTSTWQSRSSALLAAPGAIWARGQLTTTVVGFGVLGGVGPASDGVVAEYSALPVRLSSGGGLNVVEAGEEQGIEVEPTDHLMGPSDLRQRVDLDEEAPPNVPFPSESVSPQERVLPNLSTSQNSGQVVVPLAAQPSLSPPLVALGPPDSPRDPPHLPGDPPESPRDSPDAPGNFHDWSGDPLNSPGAHSKSPRPHQPPSNRPEEFNQRSNSPPAALPKPPNLSDERPEITSRSSVGTLPAHSAEELLQRSLSPPASVSKPPNLAAALSLFNRPTGLLTLDEQLESLTAELRKLDHRLCAVTSQSVSSLFDSGLSTGNGDDVLHEDGNGFGDLGNIAVNEGSPAAMPAPRDPADLDDRTERGDVSSPQPAFLDELDPHAGGADVSSLPQLDDDDVADRAPETGVQVEEFGADVTSGTRGRGVVVQSPQTDFSDAPLVGRQPGTEASGDSSGESGRASRTEPESSASPESERTFRPHAAETAHVESPSFSSVGWAAALEIDGPDSLLAGSVNFSPWHASDVSEPFSGFAGAVRIGSSELRQAGVNMPPIEPAGDSIQGHTSDGSGAFPSQVAVGKGETPLLDANSKSDGSGLEPSGAATSRKPKEFVGRKTKPRREQQTEGLQKSSGLTPRPSTKVAGLSLIRPSAAKRNAVPRAPTAATWKRALIPGSNLPAKSATEGPVRPTGPIGGGIAMPSTSGRNEAPSVHESAPKEPESGTLRGPEAVQTPSSRHLDSGRSPFADPARSPSSRQSGPSTPSSVRSSWSSFVSERSGRGEEPVRRFESILREGGDRGGRPGSKGETEKRKRAKELKDRAKSFDKEHRQRRERRNKAAR